MTGSNQARTGRQRTGNGHVVLQIDEVEAVCGSLLEKSDPLRFIPPVFSPFSLRAAGGDVAAHRSRRKPGQLRPPQIVKPGLDVIHPTVVKGQLLIEIGDGLLSNRQTEFHKRTKYRLVLTVL